MQTHLNVGQTATVNVPILHDDIAFHQGRALDFAVYEGEYTFRVGGSSNTDSLTATLSLK